ncbi:MAG: phage head-tail connector protein [Gemmataceae bacterium]
MSLDTLANVKARLGITGSADDTLIGLLQDAADAWVANHCVRDFAGGSFTEYHPGATGFVFLRNYPVQSVTSLRVDVGYGFGSTTELATTAYVVHTDRGVIQSLIGTFLPTPFAGGWDGAPRTVRVEYATATGAVPADVKEAYALLVGHWYRHVKTQVAAGYQNVTQQTYGGATAIFAKDQIAGLPTPPDVDRLLNRYRVPPL